MKIYTSYYAKLKHLREANIVPIATSVKLPEWSGISGRTHWLKCVAPHLDMLKLPPRLYVPKYEAILERNDPRRIVNLIKKMSGGKDVALMCFEKDPDKCHRLILGIWLNRNAGCNVKEYGEDEPIAVQSNLFEEDTMSGTIDRAEGFINKYE